MKAIGVKLIIGLGNPGKEYEKNRHNAGFMALDFIAKHLENSSASMTLAAKASRRQKPVFAKSARFNAIIQELQIPEIKNRVLLVYPQTYINDSGKTVKALIDFYKLSPQENILVIHDDVDLPLGAIRFTEDSGAAGHNGVQSIIEHLGTKKFNRIRIGIETRTDKSILPTDKFVLQNFTPQELTQIPFSKIQTLVNSELMPVRYNSIQNPIYE